MLARNLVRLLLIRTHHHRSQSILLFRREPCSCRFATVRNLRFGLSLLFTLNGQTRHRFAIVPIIDIMSTRKVKSISRNVLLCRARRLCILGFISGSSRTKHQAHVIETHISRTHASNKKLWNNNNTQTTHQFRNSTLIHYSKYESLSWRVFPEHQTTDARRYSR